MLRPTSLQRVDQCVLGGGCHLTSDRQQYQAQAKLSCAELEQLQQIDRADIERGGEPPEGIPPSRP
jgi:hypothetical protein